MTPFDRLHPAVQHHIVNSLGWSSLRPLQEQAIEPLLDGRHALLIAPTAGGKTEAAVFPILSRMLTEHWVGQSVLYLCPLRALLNNLEPRLNRYLGYVGRRAALWHGDVGPAVRRRILQDPPDLLLTTPESLEVMLVSPRVDHRRFLADVHSVIVDEVHSFGGDDRGWHLLAVLERVSRLAGRPLQRIGLSATVANAEELLHWLVSGAEGERQVVRGGAGFDADADVAVDYVGSDTNAATLIAGLHGGEKRLVFCDSRASGESIASLVRKKGTSTFVSHSSLSQEERRVAEQSFAESSDCVVVATSTLELGIDVGDLDRVIQIDAPGRVASFLQRLGRSGRRAGTQRNCLFLTRDGDSLVRAVALRALWAEGYVEQVVPPPAPMHLFAQQVLALCLQERGLPVGDWRRWLKGHSGFNAMTDGEREEIIRFMLDRRFLFEDAGLWSLGTEAEEEFGRRHFLDLVSAFTTEQLFAVQYGEVELGWVHHATFALRRDGPAVLLLAGRPWTIQHIDWKGRTAYVVPTEAPGESRWLGDGVPASFELCQKIARVLDGQEQPPAAAMTKRALAMLEEVRAEFTWLPAEGTCLRSRPDGRIEWWTFAGSRANATLAGTLASAGLTISSQDNFVIRFGSSALSEVERCVRRVRAGEVPLRSPDVDERALEGLKFSVCLPEHLAEQVIQRRGEDRAAVTWAMRAVISTQR